MQACVNLEIFLNIAPYLGFIQGRVSLQKHGKQCKVEERRAIPAELENVEEANQGTEKEVQRILELLQNYSGDRKVSSSLSLSD